MQCQCGVTLYQDGHLFAASERDVRIFLGKSRGLLEYRDQQPAHDIKVREGRVVAEGSCRG